MTPPRPPKDHPLLFSAPLVQALLAGRKTQTRRLVRFQPIIWAGVNADPTVFSWCDDSGYQRLHHTDKGVADLAPFCRIQPGDRLWVRETFTLVPRTAYGAVPQRINPEKPHQVAIYRAGWEKSPPGTWRPSIFMPRWASRITLAVTAVRAERLQDITEAEARAEGVDGVLVGGYDFDARAMPPAIANFRRLWDQINTKPGQTWDANPVVWVIEFTQVAP